MSIVVAVAGSNQIKPARSSCSVHGIERESHSLERTSALDFNKEGGVIQI